MNDQNVFARSNTSPAPSTFVPQASQEKKKRGFAAMDRTEVRALARKGGINAHRAGTAHEFSSDEARAAGRKGGIATHAGRKAAQERAQEPTRTPESQPS
jgi:general stress protein YciG